MRRYYHFVLLLHLATAPFEDNRPSLSYVRTSLSLQCACILGLPYTGEVAKAIFCPLMHVSTTFNKQSGGEDYSRRSPGIRQDRSQHLGDDLTRAHCYSGTCSNPFEYECNSTSCLSCFFELPSTGFEHTPEGSTQDILIVTTTEPLITATPYNNPTS